VLLWAAPNWGDQIALTAYVTIAFMLVDTFGTLLSVPYLSLIPEITQDYDERTSLAGFRTAFQLIGSLAVVITAPMLIDAALESGLTQKQGYMTAGAFFGGLSKSLYEL
jgi:Na+/melibiose symporter-like transporter